MREGGKEFPFTVHVTCTKMSEKAVNRALLSMWDTYKILLTAAILFAGSILTALFATFSTFASSLMQKTLFLIPCFLTLGLLLSLGSVLCKLYLEEIRRNKVHLVPTMKMIYARLVGASYFSVPFLTLFGILWMTIGLFELLTFIPYLGTFFATLFAFIPFLIHFSFYFMIVFGLFGLFLLAPLLATTADINRTVLEKLLRHLLKNPYRHVINFFIALFPALLLGLLGYLSLQLCTFCHQETHFLFVLLQNVSYAIPFTLLLLFPAIFFFQYAIESYLMVEVTE